VGEPLSINTLICLYNVKERAG